MIARLVFKTYSDPNDPEVECIKMNICDDHKEWTIQQWNEDWPSLIGVEWLEETEATIPIEGQFDLEEGPAEDIPDDLPYRGEQLALC